MPNAGKFFNAISMNVLLINPVTSNVGYFPERSAGMKFRVNL